MSNKKEYMKEYRKKNKEKISERQIKYNKEWRKTHDRSEEGKRYYNKNKHRFREKHLIETYGINIEQYNDIFNKQEGKCAICGIHQSELSKALHVDHDHSTGIIRGLLCQKCNQGLGLFNDSIELLGSAREYLVGVL